MIQYILKYLKDDSKTWQTWGVYNDSIRPYVTIEAMKQRYPMWEWKIEKQEIIE